uniref:Phosphoribulokinase, chloroplastic n=1 Tax=Kryptoperidinium triquetrum TaxID=66468 RepID=Q5ENS2_KRYTR|nr:chloroplast phosphoribulokinase [Heterocapsa triquetra]
MARSQSLLIPAALLAAALCFVAQRAFVAPSAPASRTVRRLTALRANPNSVPTGLVWPSPEAEEKLREVDGIKMYPTHAWTDDMQPIVPAEKKLEDTPVIIGVAADSGCGKSTFLRRILGALGTDVVPGHTAVGDMMTVVCLDDYHTNDRAGRKATGWTALDAKENDFALMGTQIEALKQKKAVYKPIYNHDTGNKDPPELLQPNKVMVFEGLHPIYDEKARAQLDLGIYIDIVNEVKFDWKVKRDVEERGWTEDQVREDINKRLPDFSAYVDPQKANADVVLRYEPSDKGLPFLKVKLIQKKGGAFPVMTLKKDLTLTGSKPGATLKMYDEDWFGNDVTVVEMDGEIDMDNMEAQLKEIEENLEGLGAKSATELTDAMMKLKSSPGSQNGTGMLQTVIAMKVREVYEKITGKFA